MGLAATWLHAIECARRKGARARRLPRVEQATFNLKALLSQLLELIGVSSYTAGSGKLLL